MVALGDADALNLRHIRRHRGHSFSSWPPGAQGRKTERAVTRPIEGSFLPPKRTLNRVPATTALVLTGSAIALAGYLGAASNSTGQDGGGARQGGLAARSAASHQPAGAGTGTGPGTGGAGGCPAAWVPAWQAGRGPSR